MYARFSRDRSINMTHSPMSTNKVGRKEENKHIQNDVSVLHGKSVVRSDKNAISTKKCMKKNDAE